MMIVVRYELIMVMTSSTYRDPEGRNAVILLQTSCSTGTLWSVDSSPSLCDLPDQSRNCPSTCCGDRSVLFFLPAPHTLILVLFGCAQLEKPQQRVSPGTRAVSAPQTARESRAVRFHFSVNPATSLPQAFGSPASIGPLFCLH